MVAVALQIATAMVNQFLPELAKPLAACGMICNNDLLTKQLNTFKHTLRPDNFTRAGELRTADTVDDPDFEFPTLEHADLMDSVNTETRGEQHLVR